VPSEIRPTSGWSFDRSGRTVAVPKSFRKCARRCLTSLGSDALDGAGMDGLSVWDVVVHLTDLTLNMGWLQPNDR
jgi:hypothetical protein